MAASSCAMRAACAIRIGSRVGRHVVWPNREIGYELALGGLRRRVEVWSGLPLLFRLLRLLRLLRLTRGMRTLGILARKDRARVPADCPHRFPSRNQRWRFQPSSCRQNRRMEDNLRPQQPLLAALVVEIQLW